MFYLLFAIASSAMVSVCMRLSQRYVRNTMAMFTANYGICLAISRFYTGSIRLFTFEDGTAVVLGLVSGLLYLVCFVLLRQSIRYNGVVLSSASMKLGGVLVPVVTAAAFFHEQIGVSRLLGVVFAVAAILLINIEKEDLAHDGKRIWLVILLALNGLTDTMANIYDKIGPEALKSHYLFYTFLAALLLAFAAAVWKRERAGRADIFFGLLIGIPNYYSARFLLLALGEVPAVIVYPAYSVGAIVTVTVIGLAVFQEKLSRRKAGALVLILAALVMLNIS